MPLTWDRFCSQSGGEPQFDGLGSELSCNGRVGATWQARTLSGSGRLLPVDSAAQQTCRVSPPSLVTVVRNDGRDTQRAGEDGQHDRRSWSVSLAKLVSCCGVVSRLALCIDQQE